jgi:hypothetical protein
VLSYPPRSADPDDCDVIMLAIFGVTGAFLRNHTPDQIEQSLEEILGFIASEMQPVENFLKFAEGIFPILCDLYAAGFHAPVHAIFDFSTLGHFLENANFMIHVESFASLGIEIMKAHNEDIQPGHVHLFLTFLLTIDCGIRHEATLDLLVNIADTTGLKLLFDSPENQNFASQIDTLVFWRRDAFHKIYWRAFLAEANLECRMTFLITTECCNELIEIGRSSDMIPAIMDALAGMSTWTHMSPSELETSTSSFLREMCESWIQSENEGLTEKAEILRCHLCHEAGYSHQ